MKSHGVSFSISLGKEVNMKNYISSLFFGLSVALLGTGCSSESPFDVAEDDFSNVKDSQGVSEEDAVPGSSTSTSDRLVYCSSSTESNYKDETETFLYKGFSVEVDLTLFKQVTDNWEKMNSHKGDYNDGDPAIAFYIKTFSDDTLVDSVKTDVFKPGEDLGKWVGHQYFTKSFSGGVNKIHVCPEVYERNVFEPNVFHSSGYCYVIHDAGDKVGTPITQNDSYATDCELEWTVNISYQ